MEFVAYQASSRSRIRESSGSIDPRPVTSWSSVVFVGKTSQRRDNEKTPHGPCTIREGLQAGGRRYLDNPPCTMAVYSGLDMTVTDKSKLGKSILLT